jgi:hypothetical protein
MRIGTCCDEPVGPIDDELRYRVDRRRRSSDLNFKPAAAGIGVRLKVEVQIIGSGLLRFINIKSDADETRKFIADPFR